MTEISDLLTTERVTCRSNVTSKKKVLEMLGGMIVQGEEGLTQGEVLESLINRERLGSTGLGHGAAIPHGRMKSLERPLCAFLKLKEGVDFDAVDGEVVDLVCALLVPEKSTHEHLQLLATLAEMFSDEEFCVRLRTAKTSEELYALLTHWRSRSEMEREKRPCA